MEATQSSNVPITVFYSYAHKDKPLRDKLATHLRLLKSQGYIADWSDQDVKPGQEWGKEIRNKLESADIILLLVSPSLEDESSVSMPTIAKPARRRKRDLYKTIEKIEDYSIGVKIQHKMRIVRRNFSLDAANRRSKGFSFLLLFLFSVLEVLALPLIVSQLVASSWIVIASFVLSSLLFVMGITGKNNLIANIIVLVYCVTWTLLGYFFLRTIDHIQLTFLSALLGSVLISCLQLVLFRTRNPRRRLPFFPKSA